MSFTPKTNWQYNEVLTEQDMNRIESGMATHKEQLDTQAQQLSAQSQQLSTHAADRSNPHSVTTAQIGAETPSGAQTKVDAHKNTATAAHKASAIALDDTGNRFAATDLEGAMVELFSSVSNGKSLVATAITGKGGTVAGTAPYTFQSLADGVSAIVTGKRFASGTGTTATVSGYEKLSVRGLSFKPRTVVGFYPNGQFGVSIMPNSLAETAWVNFYINYGTTFYPARLLTEGSAYNQFQRLADGFDMICMANATSIVGTTNTVHWWAFE